MVENLATERKQMIAFPLGEIIEVADTREAFIKHLEHLTKTAIVASCADGAGCCGGSLLRKETMELRAYLTEQLKMLIK